MLLVTAMAGDLPLCHTNPKRQRDPFSLCSKGLRRTSLASSGNRRLRFAPLPFLIDLEVLAADLNRPDLGHFFPVHFDRELERTADE